MTIEDATPDPQKVLRTLWLVRDRIGGALMDVDVWSVEPARVEFDDGDVMWFLPSTAMEVRGQVLLDDDGLSPADENQAVVDTWSLEEARQRIGRGAPETDRECVRVGPEPGGGLPEEMLN